MDPTERARRIAKVMPRPGEPWAPPRRAAAMWRLLADALEHDHDVAGAVVFNAMTENGTVRALCLRWRADLRVGWGGHGRGRGGRAGLHELSHPAPRQNSFDEPTRKAQRRDQTPQRGRRHLPADIQDRDGAEPLLRQARRQFPFIERIIGDAGYQGPKMAAAVQRTGPWEMQIIRRCDQHRFVVLPKRWIVERTIGWISHHRRLARDFERHVRCAAAFVRLAMIRIMMRRLARYSG